MVNTSFIENSGYEAGAIHTEFGTAGGTFVNCLFRENTSQIEGGAINPGSNGTLTFINCTFADNSVVSTGGGGAIYAETTGPDGLVNLTNCILWGNLAGEDPNQIDDSLGKVTLDYSDIQGGWTGNGSNNIDEDPLFVDAANDDYRLMLGSPCFDTGDPIVPAELVDTYDVDQDGDTDEETPDLDLLDRIVNSLIDMGAYEINCPWDLNGDCVVNTSDLLILFSQWGPPPPPRGGGPGEGLERRKKRWGRVPGGAGP